MKRIKCKHEKTKIEDNNSADGNYVYRDEVCEKCGEIVKAGERRHRVFSVKGIL